MTETNTSAETSYFPAAAPASFKDPAEVRAMLSPTLDALAQIVAAIGRDRSGWTKPTPCASYPVQQLTDHVLGYLTFFAAALAGDSERPDPEQYRVAAEQRPLEEVVRVAAERIDQAAKAGAAERRVRLAQAQMDGDAVLAMMLGEYLIHGWDLARATGQDFPAVEDRAADAAREFLAGMVTPEYRSAEGQGGYFGAEVTVPADASAMDRLLGFAGRNPYWE